MARYLFYCVNGTGLGHVTRILAIARQLRKQRPDSEFLILTSSENTSVLWKEGFASVKVPSFEAKSIDDRLPVSRLAHALTAQVVATFQPDVAVIDSQPAGMFTELLSPLTQITKRIFIFGMFPNYLKQATYRIATQFYTRIVMPFHEDEKDLVPIDFGDRATWVGDILVRSADEILPRADARRRIGLDEKALVFYVGLGGGGNPQNAEALDWVLNSLSPYPEISVACALQPLSKQADTIFQRENCTAIAHVPMMEYYSAFDAAITAAGFSCGEFAHAGVPPVWLPLGFPSTDQEFNAERFARHDLGYKVTLFDSDGFKKAIEKLLDENHRRDMAMRLRARTTVNGAETAARAIIEHVEA